MPFVDSPAGPSGSGATLPDPIAPFAGDRLTAFLDAALDPIVVGRWEAGQDSGDDFVVVHGNPAWRAQTAPLETLGRRGREIAADLGLSDAQFFQACARAAAGAGTQAVEVFASTLRRWFVVEVAALDGEHLVATFRDASTQRETELHLTQLQAEQAAILDSGTLGVVRLRDRRIVWANGAFQRLLGYRLDELLGQTTRMLYPSDAAFDAFQAGARDVLGRGEVFHVECEKRRKDGSTGWFAVYCRRVSPGSDEVIGLTVDISERRAAQAAVARSEARLKEAQQIARIGSWERDIDSTQLHWSDEMFRLYGMPVVPPGPTIETCMATVLEEDRAPTQAAFDASLRDGSPIDLVQRVRLPDGDIRHIRVRGRFTLGADGRLEHAAGTAQDVTRDVLQTAALAANERRLEGIFASMSEGLVVHGPDGRVVDANPAAEHLLGLSRDELLGRSPMDPRWKAHREDGTPLDGHEHPAMRALTSGRPLRDQVMGVESPRRGPRWISVNASPIVGDAGAAPVGVVATFVDITERRELEARLAASLAQLRDLYDHAPSGHYSLDADGRYVHVNATALEWLGCTRDELVGQARPTDFMAEEDRARFDELFPRFVAEGMHSALEYDLVGRHGQRRRISARATALRDAQGRFVMSRSVMHDITELHRTRLHLQELLRVQGAMLDNDQIGILRFEQGRVVWQNRAIQRIFGYAPDELAGASSRLLYADDAAYEAIASESRAVLDAGEPFRRQLPLQRRGGERVWIDASGVRPAPERDETIWFLVDLTPMKRAEESRLRNVELQAENQRLLETRRLKDQLLANVSHEMRTPLNAVIGYAHLLHKGVVPLDSPKVQTYLGQIGDSGRQLLNLIDTMLDLASLGTGSLVFRPEPLRLPAIAVEVLAAQRALAAERQVAMRTEIDPGLGELRLDPLRLRQVISIYLDNAIRFSPPGATVTVRARPEGDAQVRLEVEDHGVGIVQNDLPRLFQEFQQLSTGLSKTHQGAGLGLALVRRLVEAQGGTVGVRSAAGVGSVFHVVLPRNAAPPAR